MDALRFNTAIAKLIELTNPLTALAGGRPARSVEPLVLMLRRSPRTWPRSCGSGWATTTSLAYADFPVADPALLVAESVTYPVQVNGKVRGRVEVAADAAEDAVRAAALAEVAEAPGGQATRRRSSWSPAGWSASSSRGSGSPVEARAQSRGLSVRVQVAGTSVAAAPVCVCCT